MASTGEAAAHIFMTTARFHDLVAQGVVTKSERGGYNLNKVREEYIRHIRKNASGHGRDSAGLSKERAALARAQTEGVALKNAIARGEMAPLALIKRALDIVIATCRERILAIPGKIAAACEMRTRDEIAEILHEELCEVLDELTRPILTGGDAGLLGGDSGDSQFVDAIVEASAEIESS